MHISPEELPIYKNALLHWANKFTYCVLLDNCQSEVDKYGEFECMVGVAGENAKLIQDIDTFQAIENQWLLGVFSYDLKNEIEPSLTKKAVKEIDLGNLAFFVPETLVCIYRNSLEIVVEGKPLIWKDLFENKFPNKEINDVPLFHSNFSQATYLETIKKLREHIIEGDFYEINLSQRYLANGKLANPASIFQQLTQVSPVPFATFFKWKDIYVMGASPERFLQLKAGKLLAQPIKGTAKRGENEIEDKQNYQKLANSEKEQAENIMIVDLMRNDLYKSAEIHSVEVPLLFEVQTFPTVHQLVSSITAKKKPEISTWQVIKNTFPPGSMTGAPKVMTMKMIDKYESVSRGIYSGSIGYIKPNGDFDLNVVIRSLIYDAKRQQISYHVGGAIVYDSEPQAEYEETLLKAAAIQSVLGLKNLNNVNIS
ncbi:MAG: anthranilate synthase component I family protein [Bacteroidia bacterium]